MDTVRRIIWAKNKACIKFPFTGIEQPSYFGEGELADFLSFGFSYVEHEDHVVEYIIASPCIVKEIIQKIDAVILTVGTNYIGTLWTGKIYVSDKVGNKNILFANTDLSVVLDLNTDKMEG